MGLGCNYIMLILLHFYELCFDCDFGFPVGFQVTVIPSLSFGGCQCVVFVCSIVVESLLLFRFDLHLKRA